MDEFKSVLNELYNKAITVDEAISKITTLIDSVEENIHAV